MKNLKHKFILCIIAIIVGIIGFQIITSFSFYTRDTNSYVTLIEGKGDINTQSLILQKRVILQVGDIVTTQGKSMAVIEWGEGSITRLGEKSQMKVRENTITSDISTIQISLELLEGKSWTKVVTLLGGNSYFKQYFDTLEAGVRGTTFDVDLTSKIIIAQNHQVTLKKQNGELVTIPENKPYSFSLFSFIELSEYIARFQDTAWTTLNQQLDTKYSLEMAKKALGVIQKDSTYLTILEIFFPKYRVLAELHGHHDMKVIQKTIAALSLGEKKSLYTSVLTEYQSLHSASTDQPDLYATKLVYKETLLLLSDDALLKENLVTSSVYDIQDIFDTKNISGLQNTLDFVSSHSDITKNIPLEVKGIFSTENLKILPPDLQEIMKKNASGIFDMFNTNLPKPDISLDTIKTGLDNLLKKVQ